MLPPCHGAALAEALRQHHVYLTASVNEPGSNHQNEGALCGLPLLYRESASMPEYGAGYGLAYNDATFESQLEELARTYGTWVVRMPAFPHTSDRMADDYLRLFETLTHRRATGGRWLRWLRWRMLPLFVASGFSAGTPRTLVREGEIANRVG
jgi:hypothetical protein